MPEFEGRQVVILHNQRDFLFFRRHRYAFRSIEKAALQEIGPRFTLKLRWVKKGLPAVLALGEPPKPLEIGDDPVETKEPIDGRNAESGRPKVTPPTQDEYTWMWKVFCCLPLILSLFLTASFAARVGDNSENILPVIILTYLL